jgi:hypothetical protein
LTVMAVTVPVRARMLPRATSFCLAREGSVLARKGFTPHSPPKKRGVQSMLRAS